MKIRGVTRKDWSRNKGQKSRGGGNKKGSTSDVDKIEAMMKKKRLKNIYFVFLKKMKTGGYLGKKMKNHLMIFTLVSSHWKDFWL